MRTEFIMAMALVLACPALIAGPPTPFHHFAQIGDGGGVRTVFLILNPNPDAITIELSLFSGNPGVPLELTVGGSSTSNFEGQVPGGGTFRLETAGTAPQAVAGWASLVASRPVGAQVLFEITTDGSLVTQAAVESNPPLRRSDVFVDTSPASRTGIALANLSAITTIRVVLTLRRADGEAVDTVDLILAPRGHRAIFLDELFPGAGTIRGSLRITASGRVAIITLQQSGLVLGTLPPVAL